MVVVVCTGCGDFDLAHKKAKMNKDKDKHRDWNLKNYQTRTHGIMCWRLDTLKGHKSKFTIVNGETFRNYFIFLPAYSLNMYVAHEIKK